MPVELGPIVDVGVLGGGAAFPARQLDNLEVLRELAPLLWADRGRVPDDEELAFVAAGIEQSLGVKSRAWMHAVGKPLDHAGEETVVDLSVAAARAALKGAGLSASDLSLIVCSTSTPHRMTSTVSAAVGTALATRAACLDARTGCSAGLFALGTAALHVQAGAGPALVVGVDAFSKIIPPGSRLAALSLGDGAGAIVLGGKPGARVDSLYLETDGALGKLITTDGALPPTAAELERGGYLLSGAPEELADIVPGKYQAAIERVLARAKLTPGDVDVFVPHQTSRALIAEVCRRTGVPAERTFVNVERHANIGCAGWMAALVEARAEGRVRPGKKLLTAAVGGGMSWAAAVLTC